MATITKSWPTQEKIDCYGPLAWVSDEERRKIQYMDPRKMAVEIESIQKQISRFVKANPSRIKRGPHVSSN